MKPRRVVHFVESAEAYAPICHQLGGTRSTDPAATTCRRCRGYFRAAPLPVASDLFPEDAARAVRVVELGPLFGDLNP